MATLNDLAPRHTSIDSSGRQHLRQLVGSWNLLADLAFADLLLLAPVNKNLGGDRGLRFVALGQIRPATTQTLYQEDQVGRFHAAVDRPAAQEAIESGSIVQIETEREDPSNPDGPVRVALTAVPVRVDGEVVAVVSSESRMVEGRARSELDRRYLGVADQIFKMIASGQFPFASEEADSEVSPRVGDGVLVLDADARITYTSPNAVSALHRMGFHANATGRHLDDIGFQLDAVRTAFRLRVPIADEIERGTSVTIMVRLLPLLDGAEINGAIALLRDVSDLRSQERLLVSMDATIREIHHRVKNNLQTVSSLLRMQGRRVENAEAKDAIDESVRRIRSIALVHEILAQEGGDDVEFGEIARPIVRMVDEGLVAADMPIDFRVVGEGPVMAATTASSVAVVLTELLQNAVEHGYPRGSEGGQITVELVSTPTGVVVRVHDDGAGLPDDFDLANSEGLGLTIARTLASGELGGELKLRPASDGGTVAELEVAFERE